MLSDSLLSGRSPGARDWKNGALRMSVGAGQHPDSQTHSNQQPPSKTNGGESSTAEQPVHWESVWRTGPLDSIFLSHFLCMCLSHYFIFSLWIQSGQQNSVWNVVLAASGGHSQILCCLSLGSQLLARLSVSSFHICHTSETPWLAY